MKTTREFLTLIAAIAIFGGSQIMAQVIFINDFESSDLGTYNASTFSADWNGDSIRSSQGIEEGRAVVVNEGSKALRVKYPAGLYGSSDSSTGAQFKMEFGQGYEAVELEYRLKFEDGFDFVRGGKLPGLAGGAANSGGSRPNGTDGFSARMMWRTNGSSGSPTTSSVNGSDNRAKMVQYIYHPDQTANGGTNADDFDWDDGPLGEWEEFETDQWYHFRHRIIMNTPGVNGEEGLHDGVVQAWLDGVQVLNVDDIRFRDVASLQIDQLYFSTFFGGGSSNWATTKDEYAYFDDFKITAVGQPGDFDYDGDVDIDDINQFSGNIGASPVGNLASLDLDSDGDIDGHDMTMHYSQLIETSNGTTGTYAGDLDLDGDVDVVDIGGGDGATLIQNLGTTSGANWSNGDLDGDGDVDVIGIAPFFGDASIYISNLGNSNGSSSASPAASAVPEAGSLTWLVLAGVCTTVRRRRLM